MVKTKKPESELIRNSNLLVDERALFESVVEIIENRKLRAAAHVNYESSLMFWEVGRYINYTVLDFKRAAYGKKILSELATKLVARYGRNFAERNIYPEFPDIFYPCG